MWFLPLLLDAWDFLGMVSYICGMRLPDISSAEITVGDPHPVVFGDHSSGVLSLRVGPLKPDSAKSHPRRFKLCFR